jgi:hypothetical protein
MVIFVQYIFWVYVLLELFLYLRKKGVRDGVLIVMEAFMGLNASNFVQLNTIWKDIPYTLSVLWSLVLLAKLSIDFDKYKGKWYIYCELFLALSGIYLFRKNGFVTFAVIALFLIIILRKNIKIWCTIAITLLVVFAIKGPLYDYYEVQDSGVYGMYIGLGQDILGVYYAGGEVSDETLDMVNVMTRYNNAEYDYQTTWSNQSYYLYVKPYKFVVNYIDTFLKNPIIMSRAIVDRIGAAWDIYIGQGSVIGCVNYYDTQDGVEAWNDYYPERVYNWLYEPMKAITDYTASTQWLSAFIWRCGIYTLLGILSVIYVYFKVGINKSVLMLAPFAGQIVSLLLTTGWSEFRYFWVLNLMNISLLLLSLIIVGRELPDEGINNNSLL